MRLHTHELWEAGRAIGWAASPTHGSRVAEVTRDGVLLCDREDEGMAVELAVAEVRELPRGLAVHERLRGDLKRHEGEHAQLDRHAAPRIGPDGEVASGVVRNASGKALWFVCQMPSGLEVLVGRDSVVLTREMTPELLADFIERRRWPESWVRLMRWELEFAAEIAAVLDARGRP